MALLPVGATAPDLEARRIDGTSVRLSELRGRYVLVYFYPKDLTPGCTTEACTLNQGLDELGESGAEVIGVSFDTWQTHQRFQAKHDLRFPLAADDDHRIAAAYGVGRMLGLLPVTNRVSFLVDPQGRIAQVWSKVRPGAHAAEVLAAVRRHSGVVELSGQRAEKEVPTAPPG
jgi:thioredoxin-dependent peroxiredoxin